MRRVPGPIHLWKSVLVLGPVLVIGIAMHGIWRIQSEAGRLDTDGLSNIAERVARLVEAYIARTITITGIIAAAPTLNDAAAAGSAVARDDAAVKRDDDHWTRRTPEGLALTRRIERLPASAFLNHVTRAPGSAYREIFVADAAGRLVAISNRTENFDQQRDAWWPLDLDHTPPSCRQVTAPCVTILDVELDPSAGVYGFDVIVPVISRDDVPVGVLKAVIDPAELNALLGLTHLSPSLRVALIRRDGSPVLAPDTVFSTTPANIAGLAELAEGAEAMLPLSGDPNGGVAHVRRLTGVMGREWYLAVTDVDGSRPRSLKLFVLWAALALGMFVVAASAFAIRTGQAAAPEVAGGAR